jgi:hypothetical protein
MWAAWSGTTSPATAVRPKLEEAHRPANMEGTNVQNEQQNQNNIGVQRHGAK